MACDEMITIDRRLWRAEWRNQTARRQVSGHKRMSYKRDAMASSGCFNENLRMGKAWARRGYAGMDAVGAQPMWPFKYRIGVGAVQYRNRIAL